MFPGPKTSYMEANTQKDGKTRMYALEGTHRCPEHGPCDPSIAYVPQASLNTGQNCFLLFFFSGKKPNFWVRLNVKTLSIYTTLVFHNLCNFAKISLEEYGLSPLFNISLPWRLTLHASNPRVVVFHRELGYHVLVSNTMRSLILEK